MDPATFLKFATMSLSAPLAKWAKLIAGAALQTEVDPVILVAIMAQESGGKDPKVIGFDGYGRGLMQIDIRSHPTFCAAFWGRTKIPLWQIPKFNIDYGTELMRENLAFFRGDIWPAVAAFNAGPSTVAKRISTLGQGASASERYGAANAVTYNGQYLTRVRGYFDKFTAAFAAAQAGGGNV